MSVMRIGIGKAGSVLMLLLMVNMAAVQPAIAVQEPNKETNNVTAQQYPLIVDAQIDIYPDAYTQQAGETGQINVDADTEVGSAGITNYYVKLPVGIEYIDVVDGNDPTGVYFLDSGESVVLPELGVVDGLGTVIHWQVVHAFSNSETNVLDVLYTGWGYKTVTSEVSATDSVTGISAWDSDQFTVDVE